MPKHEWARSGRSGNHLAATKPASASDNDGENTKEAQPDDSAPTAYIPPRIRDVVETPSDSKAEEQSAARDAAPAEADNEQTDTAPAARKSPRPLSNQELAVAVANAIRKADISQYEIDIDTRGGVVTLDGNVGKPAYRQAAEEAASKVEGVARVVNRISVRSVNESHKSADAPSQNSAALFPLQPTPPRSEQVQDVAEDLPRSISLAGLVGRDSPQSEATEAAVASEAVVSEELGGRTRIDSECQPKWEYNIVYAPFEEARAKLNELGGDGWELVAAHGAYYYFKRRK